MIAQAPVTFGERFGATASASHPQGMACNARVD